MADNVRYGPRLRGETLTDMDVARLLTMADIDPSFASKNSGELSVGQAQRVALARTLANGPEVFLYWPINRSQMGCFPGSLSAVDSDRVLIERSWFYFILFFPPKSGAVIG